MSWMLQHLGTFVNRYLLEDPQVSPLVLWYGFVYGEAMTTQTTTNSDLDSIAASVDALRAWRPIERPHVARLDAWARLNVSMQVGRETAFTPAAVGVKAYRDPEGTVRSPEVVVYGEMTFKDRKDSAARVCLSETWNYCVSSAWDGSSFRPMPDGACKRVTEAVRAAIGPIDWTAVGVEFFAGERNAMVSGKISEAVRVLEAAVNSMRVPQS